jgi:recombination protein RecR
MSNLIKGMVSAFQALPGVGPKTAQRMAYYLLERNRDGGRELAESIAAAMAGVGNCERCRDFSEQALCERCTDVRRDDTRLCIVENPADVTAIDSGTDYRGRYYVLMGNLSPLDGIGPDELGIPQLAARLEDETIAELILATSATVEGEATAHFIAEIAHAKQIPVTRIAQGVPFGGELEFVDSGTLSQAFSGRRAWG